MTAKIHYCPLCFRPMTVNEFDKDVYLCYNTHLDGNYAWIDLNPDKKREIKFPPHIKPIKQD